MLHLNLFKRTGVTTIALILLMATNPTATGADGASLAKESMAWMQSNSSRSVPEAEVMQFKENLQNKVKSLAEPERIDFLSTLAKTTVSDDETTAQTAVGLIRWSDAPREDWARAFIQLFELEKPEADFTADRLLSMVAPASQLSVFRKALENSNGVPQSRLINHLFTRHPAEATEWFAKNANLSEAEKAQVLAELPVVQFMANPPEFFPGQPAPDQLLSEEEKDRKTQEWLTGQSWVLQLFSKSYLTKYPDRQTPELQAAMSKVSVLANVKLRADDSGARPKRLGTQESETTNRLESQGNKSGTPIGQTAIVQRTLLGVLAALVICLLSLVIRKRGVSR